MKIWTGCLTGKPETLLLNNGEPLLATPRFFSLILKTSLKNMEAPSSEMQRVSLGIEAHLISRFLKLIEHGFRMKIKTGRTVRELLCGQLGVSEDYLDNRIQTIFLDGKAVDDADNAWVNAGSRLALSAAMPGLVGATFRKGGRYAALRSSISYSKTKTSGVRGKGKITLKLFNMVAKELGPVFLRNGVIIDGNTFQNFVVDNLEDLKAACSSILLNNTKIGVAQLKELKWADREVFLQVTSDKSS
jgi:hypothetical protein